MSYIPHILIPPKRVATPKICIRLVSVGTAGSALYFAEKKKVTTCVEH